MVMTYMDSTKKLPFAFGVIELLSMYQLGQPPTLWSTVMKQYFALKWRSNL